MAEPMDFMPNEEFAKPGAERRIYQDAAPVRTPDVRWYRPLMDDVGVKRDVAPRRGESVVLTAAEERVIFMQFNYARYRVRTMQDALAGRAPSVQKAKQILRWYRTAHRLREQIAETNLALVLAMAKRVRIGESDFGDLISEGNMALMRSVDKFDCARGFKFSTYGCRSILKAFSRHGIKLSKYRQRFPTEFDPAMEKSNHMQEMREQSARDSAAEVRYIVESNRAELNEIERAVIVHRFGLDRPAATRQPTLAQVGEVIGVTKERVRQIQNRALEKIKLAIEGVASPVPAMGAALDGPLDEPASEPLGASSVN
ncbi:MAG: sigma-70 family RNA polymerase sigma factor [Phycisphaerae bacterium]|nr:sigma-70 family RNA polymerase sigma factor [Phycisphaerae bacterium]